MKLKSTSNYFKQSKANLLLCYKDMLWILENRGFSEKEIGYFESSYNYFCLFPDEYDGATATQDLVDVPAKELGYDGLEFSSMVHDWIYVSLRARYSVIQMRAADEIMEIIMKKMNKSKFEITWRLFRLAIIRRPFAIWNTLKTWFKIKPLADLINEMYIIFVKI